MQAVAFGCSTKASQRIYYMPSLSIRPMILTRSEIQKKQKIGSRNSTWERSRGEGLRTRTIRDRRNPAIRDGRKQGKLVISVPRNGSSPERKLGKGSSLVQEDRVVQPSSNQNRTRMPVWCGPVLASGNPVRFEPEIDQISLGFTLTSDRKHQSRGTHPELFGKQFNEASWSFITLVCSLEKKEVGRSPDRLWIRTQL